jgi:epoxyqueuosine reductase QueG
MGGVSSVVKNELTQAEIREQARQLGAEFVGFASIDSWEESKDNPVALHPQTIWPPTKTVIVLGIPKFAVAALPAALGLKDWKAANELLDAAAYRLAVFLNRHGYPSVNIPLDSSGETIPENKTVLVFSHSWAAYYAGLDQARPGTQVKCSHLKVVSLLTVFH